MKAAAAILAPMALLLSACTTPTSSGPPSAGEILNKPGQANVKDAHFTISAHVVSGSVALDVTGDGVIEIKPQQASEFTMQTIVAGQTLKFERIIAGGKEYDLAPDNPRWTVRAPTSSNPATFKGTKAAYIGEETLPLGKAWHVKAVDPNGNPFEAWVRERDGYPLKYAGNSQGTSFTAIFDRFNTGETVTPPAASDIQP